MLVPISKQRRDDDVDETKEDDDDKYLSPKVLIQRRSECVDVEF